MRKHTIKAKAGQWVRPQRLITISNPRRGKVEYIRNAKAALDFTTGFDLEIRGALSLLVDMFFVHHEHGIPNAPPSYIAGNIGVGEKRWTQTILPMLLKTKRVKIVRRNGQEWVVLTDGPDALGRMMPTGDDALDALEEVCLSDDRGWSQLQRVSPDRYAKAIAEKAHPHTFVTRKPYVADRFYREKDPAPAEPDDATDDGPILIEPELPARESAVFLPDGLREVLHDRGRLQDDERQKARISAAEAATIASLKEQNLKPAPPSDAVVPMPTAADVLKRAGYPIDRHSSGMAFWYRLEHGETLRGWINAGIPLNTIVERISRAVQKGLAPPDPNSLSAFDAIVKNNLKA